MPDQENAIQEQSFEGFIPPVSNYFRMPNGWINISAKITNLAELKVVQYVLRHTWGYREYDGKPKPITVDEFMHGRKRADGTRMDDGTGLSKPSVIQGLKYAIKHGYLICNTDDSDKARVVKSYALKMSAASEVKNLNPQEENRGKGSLPQGSNILTSEVKNLDSQEVKNLDSDQRKTEESNFNKDTTERKNDAPTTNSTPETSFSPLSIPSEPLEEIILSLEARHVFDLVCQVLYESKPPEITAKVQEQCNELVKAGVKTLEDIQALVRICRQNPKLEKASLFLGNLVNTNVLNGWKQTQKTSQSTSKPEQPKLENDLRALARRQKELAATHGGTH